MLRFRVKGKHPNELGGTSLWNLLSNNLARRTIPIYRHASTRKILRSGDQVIGVLIEKEGRPYYLRARKGVVLATGGFEYNEELKREYLAGYPTLLMATRAIPATA
jgi:3-oxosteroid 1-dehydrogenase